MLFEIINASVHGDWKTASVRPGKWPLLKVGDKVELIERWQNFYGNQAKVKGPNGEIYDIPAENIREVK